MASWLSKGRFMAKYVTEEYLDQKLDEFEMKLEKKFVSKDDFHTRMDEVVTILKRLDQERIFTVEWIRRMESDVHRIKRQLKIA